MIEKFWLDKYDRGVPKTLKPYPKSTLVEVLDESAKKSPNHPFLIFKGNGMTYLGQGSGTSH